MSEYWRWRRAAGLRKWGTKAENADPPPKPEPAGFVLWCLEERADKFTPAQRQAIQLTHVEFLSKREAADRADCSYSAYRKRLAGAERAMAIVLRAQADGVPPSRVRHGANRGRAEVHTEGTENRND